MLGRAFIAIAAISSSLVIALPSTTTLADDTGLAGMHSWRKVGRKTCFVDHYHDGAGQGISRSKAEADAIKNWEEFTALEYGSDWASYSAATNRSMKCDQLTSEHKCNISAIPCRGR